MKFEEKQCFWNHVVSLVRLWTEAIRWKVIQELCSSWVIIMSPLCTSMGQVVQICVYSNTGWLHNTYPLQYGYRIYLYYLFIGLSMFYALKYNYDSSIHHGLPFSSRMLDIIWVSNHWWTWWTDHLLKQFEYKIFNFWRLTWAYRAWPYPLLMSNNLACTQEIYSL